MIQAAQLQVIVGADVAGALSGLGRVNRAIGSTAGFFSRAAATAVGFIGGALGLGALQNVAGAAADSIFGFNASLEQSRTSFGVMLGSGVKANAFLGNLQQFALATPFEFPQLVSASQRMLAFGFSAEQVIPLLTDIGNVASASPSGFAQGLERISLALGQMQAKGRVQGDELLQLQEAGVNTGQVFAIMAQQTGLSVDALRKAQTAGKLSAATFTRAFQTFSQARFGGLMEKQSQTFTGAVSNIKDGLRGALATGFSPLFEAVRGLAVRFADFLSTAQFQAWVAQLRAGVAQAVTWFGTALPAAWTTVQGAWATLQPALAGVRDWLATNLPAAWAILQPKLAELQTWFQNTLPVATASLAGVWNDVLRPALDSIFSVLAPIAGALAQVAGVAANEAFRNLGATLAGIAVAVAVLQVPALIAGAAALTAMALAAGPLLLLAAGLGLVAFTLVKFRDALPAVGAFLKAEFLGGLQQVIQALKIAGGLIAVLANPAILKGTGVSIGDVVRGAGQGKDLFTLLGVGGPAATVAGPPLPPPLLGAGGLVDNSVVVDMTGVTVNAGDPEDVARMVDLMAARLAAEQAASVGGATGTTMPEGA